MTVDYIQKEWNVIGYLLQGYSRKEAARKVGVSLSFVANAKAKYPLFFWRKHQERKISRKYFPARDCV